MISHEIKRGINILVKKYIHTLSYEKDVLVITGEFNKIKISSLNHGKVSIKYNLKDEYHTITFSEELIYDFLLTLFWRNSDSEKIHEKRYELLTPSDWINEESYSSELSWLKDNLSGMENHVIGGNRFILEYYDNMLILFDDLNSRAANVISLSSFIKIINRHT